MAWSTASSQRAGGAPAGARAGGLGGDRIERVAVGNGVVVIAMEDCRLVRWFLDHRGAPEEITVLSQGGVQVHKVFLDPTGSHIIVAMKNHETFYLHRDQNKAVKIKSVSKYVVVVDSVAWDRENGNESTTRPILLGTTDGRIFETTIDAKLGKEKYFKPVYDFKQDKLRICGLQFEEFPSTDTEKKFFVMVATAKPTR